MAIKNKFIHFKTRAAFNANVPNPALTADEGNTFYNYTTFIQDTKEIYTHGTFYKSNTTWDMLKITEDISYAALFKNNAKVGDIVQVEGAIDFIIFSASIDNSSFTSLLQSSTSDINIYNVYYDDSTQLYIFDEDSLLSIANNNNINSIVRSYVEDTYITEKTLEKLPAGTNASITATDSILNAFAKLQGQVNAKANTSSIPTAATVTPKASGTAAVGTSTKYAREDHVHPLQTNVETATKLATPRVIAISGAVSGSATFDGSKNISINSTLNGFDASKITSGTLNADRLPNIPIEKLPAGALERMFVMESQNAAINAVKAGTIQEGDVVQIGNGGLMYFCIDDAATTFGNAFKEFTAGSATSVPWSGVTNAPTKLSQFTNDSGFLTSVPAASTTVTGGIKLNGNNSQYLAGDGSFYEINYNEINGTPDIATANTAGLVKPINVITKPTLNSITTTSERYYSVQMSNDGNMFVNVPWTSSSIPSDNVTGSGTSGYLAKFNGTNTITSGPKLSSSSSGLFLRDDGTWQIPFDISINGSGTIDSFSYQLNLNAGTGGISITNDEDNTYSINAVAASTSQFGTVKVGSNITVSSGTISLSKSNVTSALGYTPANTSDIPKIPIALPNPYALIINGTSYTGSSTVSISASKPLSIRMLASSTVYAGYSYSCGTSKVISALNGFSSTNPDSVIISSAKLIFTASNVIKMDGLDDLSGTWYIYCLSYMANNKIAVNGAVYA